MVYVIADIHGSNDRFDTMMQYVEHERPMTESDVVIIAGDAGTQYGTYNMGSLKKNMKSYDCKFIVLRGNHDKRYWKEAKVHPEKWTIEDDYAFENKYPNILYVKDEGGIYNINGYRVLFVPGGYSVDKDYRLKNGLPYEYDEELTYSEANDLLCLAETGGYDFIISHVAPTKLHPKLSEFFMPCIDQSSVRDFVSELCDEIFKVGKWKMWFFGHYHGDKYFPEENMDMIYEKYGRLDDLM